MNLFILIIFAVVALYVSATLLVFGGSFRRNVKRVVEQPCISVLIPARNEAGRLPQCLESLLRSNYPSDKFEIIVIDDRSTDGTRQIAEDFSRRYSQIKTVALTIRLENMSGKASALCQGLAHAAGEIILLTDADCQASPTWMAQMAGYFAPEVGLVGGFTLLTRRGDKNPWWAKVQTLDWVYLLTIGAGAAGLGKPVSIIGNNFAFRRAAYEAVGGYENLGFSIIEDFALMRAIHEQTPWQIIFPLDPQIIITSAPPKSWREFYEQRQRWAAGGKDVGALAKFFMVIAFLGHLAIIAAMLVSPSFAASCFLILAVSDFLLLWQSTQRLERTDLLLMFPLFEIYFFVYNFFFAPTVLLPATVRWKGVHYRWNFRGKIKRVEEKS